MPATKKRVYENLLAGTQPPESPKSLAKRLVKEAEEFKSRRAAIPELLRKELGAARSEMRSAVHKLHTAAEREVSKHWARYRSGDATRADVQTCVFAVWDAYAAASNAVRSAHAVHVSAVRLKYRELKRTPFKPSTAK